MGGFRDKSFDQSVQRLTRREREILALLAGDGTNQEIADQLFLSLSTVKGTIQQIYNKLGVSGRREAVSQGRALGYLAPPTPITSPGNPPSVGSALPMGAPFPTATALPVGTITFLFSDIEGSTPLWENQPERMVEALQIHNTVLRQAIETNAGVVANFNNRLTTLSILAGLVLDQGQAEQAVRLQSLVDSQGSQNLSAIFRSHYQRDLETARLALNAETFQAAWEAGKQMTLDQAEQMAFTEKRLSSGGALQALRRSR